MANNMIGESSAVYLGMFANKLGEGLTVLLEIFALAQNEIKHGRLRSYGKNFPLGNDGVSPAVTALTTAVKQESN